MPRRWRADKELPTAHASNVELTVHCQVGLDCPPFTERAALSGLIGSPSDQNGFVPSEAVEAPRYAGRGSASLTSADCANSARHRTWWPRPPPRQLAGKVGHLSLGPASAGRVGEGPQRSAGRGARAGRRGAAGEGKVRLAALPKAAGNQNGEAKRWATTTTSSSSPDSTVKRRLNCPSRCLATTA